MRKARKQKFLERKESMDKSHGNPVYTYVSRIDFGNMAYTAKPKQEYCRRWDYRQTVLWREQENQSKTLVVNKIYVIDKLVCNFIEKTK